MRYVAVREFLSETEMQKVFTMYCRARSEGRTDFAQRLVEEVIRPKLFRINTSLGQKNDPWYLAFAIEAALFQATQQVLEGRSVPIILRTHSCCGHRCF